MRQGIALLAEKAVAGFAVNTQKIDAARGRNPVLVTALAPKIGYDKAAAIAKKAYAKADRSKRLRPR